MARNDVAFGRTQLLRVAGLPIRYWLLAANPMLVAAIADLDQRYEARQPDAVRLAERIGNEFIPRSTLTRAERSMLLALRRRLHRGDLIADVDPEHLQSIAEHLGSNAELIEALIEFINHDRGITSIEATIDTGILREQKRLLQLPERVICDSPVASAILANRPSVASMSAKEQRRRFEYDWRRVTRSTTESTPRDWLSHVALVTLDAQPAWQSPVVTDAFVAQWTENVRTGRLLFAASSDGWPELDSRIALNPLHWESDDHFIVVALDEHARQTRVSVRQTVLLNAVRHELQDSARTFHELSQMLGCTVPDEQVALGGFVRHLASLGILQPSSPPRHRLERRATPDQPPIGPVSVDGKQLGWIDVYRHAEQGLAEATVRTVECGVMQVLHMLRQLRSDGPGNPRNERTSTDTFSFAEILRNALETDSNLNEPSASEDEAIDPAPAATRFLQRIIANAGNMAEIAIDPQTLGLNGTAAKPLDWPIDCLIRLPAEPADFTAVLDQIWPPGMLDARFADTLAEMHGSVPHVDAYRTFLDQLEYLTGVQFVELLAPPLADGAANAVRRPIYARAWTGDPHAAAYFRDDADHIHFIPMQIIQIRRAAGRLRAEIAGRPIWLVHHATRSFSPPWDRLAQILLATSPIELPWQYQHTLRSLRTLPGLPSMPRISVGGIVVAPARWRLSVDDMWDLDLPVVKKLRTMIQLRSRYGWPRWVYLSSADTLSPIACDLESLHAIRLFERLASTYDPIHLDEMLPTPEQLLVHDRAHRSHDRLVSQFQLRFPFTESPQSMATRIAPSIQSELDHPVPVPERPMHSAGCRGPPSVAEQ